ncbi:MAG: helix-turn-helix domain-containing protein [Inquilinaceae bacterium]
MLIGELAKALDVTPKTLRHYEKIGLIPTAVRSSNGYRTYSDDAVRRARLVVGLRKLNLSVGSVQALLDRGADGRGLRQRLMGRLDEQIQDYELRVAILQGQRDDLQARYDALLSTPASHPGTCICGALLQPCSCEPP